MESPRDKFAKEGLTFDDVLLVPGASANSLALKLVDYDGMCVPRLVGADAFESGKPAYEPGAGLRDAHFGVGFTRSLDHEMRERGR